MSLWGCFSRVQAQPPNVLFAFFDPKIERQGYIDATGRARIAPRFKKAGRFSEGLAQVTDELGESAFIDLTGAIVFRTTGRFRDDSDSDQGELFTKGRVIVYDDSDSMSRGVMLDRSGMVVRRFDDWTRGTFENGLTAVYERANERWGYVDIDGRQVIAPTFLKAEPFSEGLAAVERLVGRDGHEQGYIDQQGQWVMACEPWRGGPCGPFSRGRARVRDGYIDKQGRRVIREDDLKEKFLSGRPGDLDLSDFAGDLALVKICPEGGDSQLAYIDIAGNDVFSARFKDAAPFSDGLAAVYAPDKGWGYINGRGEAVIAPQFRTAGPFSDGVARVEGRRVERNDSGFSDVQVGIIDRRGRWLRRWWGEQPPPSNI